MKGKNMADAVPVPIDTETRAIPTVPVTDTHTPGPWIWCDHMGNHTTIDRATQLRGFGLGSQVLCIDLPEFIEDADKRLIAAAPTLLDALTLCAHVFREFPEEFTPETWAHVRHTALTAIDEAIARAEGRP